MRKVLLVAFVAVMGMMVSSCGKEVVLAGTTWEASTTVSSTSGGYSATLDYDYQLHFIDAENGEITVHMVYSIMGNDGVFDNTSPFTYTFDGEREGSFTATSTTEEGETIEQTSTFTYNKKDNTLTCKVENAEEVGVSEMVFTQVK